MKFYNLGIMPGLYSKTIFHAAAYEGHECFIAVSPMEPIVSLGYFQELSTSVDADFCRRSKILLMRREVGGGTTLLDSNQIFYQIIFDENNPAFPRDTIELYRKLSQPVIDTYRELGIEVRFKEVNDLVTVDEAKKISGEGGADIGKMKVFVGSFILDFDCGLMSRVFPAESEEHRMQLLKSLQNNMTSISRELGYVPPRDKIISSMKANYEKILGPLKPAELPETIMKKAVELEKIYTSGEFLEKAGKKEHGIKIADGVKVYRNFYKAVGGRVFSVFEIKDNMLDSLKIYGDFTFMPKDKLYQLEDSLIGLPLDKDILAGKIREFISRNNIDCPGVTPEDFALVLAVSV